ncbi:hypothetical protein [Gemmata obscuriglobus]|uniref:Uncharacterized protein n=1 Tax=Gemmata obscuriglobus TaxID=114 RepID=A0A2Z3GYM0_9BACT|nr:hypothetical protein [Gemmata obscuriglobus]AWM38863.1 hypothetical protein C1280_19000 [Gemmata obscuriglobus]
MDDPVPDPPVPAFDADGMMIPPWVKYPSIPRASIGWRMGEGEEYWDNFRVWWGTQQVAVQTVMQATYPEPTGWSGFYERV